MSVQPVRLSLLPEALLQMVFSFSSGEEVRRFEITCKFSRNFFNGIHTKKLWFELVRRDIPRKDLLLYSPRIDYKALFIIFFVKVYRIKPPTPRVLPRSLFIFFNWTDQHKNPQRYEGKCHSACCIKEECRLVKTLLADSCETLTKTFELLKAQVHLRSFFDERGDRVQWCLNCRRFRELSHGADPQVVPSDGNYIQHKDSGNMKVYF